MTSSRRPLIEAIVESGRDVVIATADDAESRELRGSHIHFEEVSFYRGGFSASRDIAAFSRLVQIHRKWRPVLVQHFHAKPVVYGSVAARWAQKTEPRIVNTITGLGYAFTNGGIAAKLAAAGYWFALGKADLTIFQNSDDMKLFLDRGWISMSQAKLIAGSGVDIGRFKFTRRNGRNDQSVVIILLARLLKQKGIPEFIEVARRVKQTWPNTKFILAGEEDIRHPDAVSVAWIREQGCIEYLGRLSDVGPLLVSADILLFPSYYREGLPRVILEAAAAGLPTVAFDVPGVREAIQHLDTGFLAPLHDADALTGYVTRLLEDRELRLAMGKNARHMVEQRFDVEQIKEQYLQVYRNLGVKVR